MTVPTVSIIIPAFNAEGRIREALDSVFEQTFTDFEVIVVDDGSQDGTVGDLQAFASRITLIRTDNRGPGAARNTGVAASRGRYIAFLDADDTWLPDKLQFQMEYLARYPQTGLLHTAACAPGAVRRHRWLTDLAFQAPSDRFCEIFQTDIDVNTLTVVVPRAVFDEAGGFDECREIHVEDWDLWLRISAAHPVGYIDMPTAVRRPGGVMSTDIEATFRGQAAVIRRVAARASEGRPPRGCTAEAMTRRWHRFNWELGYARLRAGNRGGARQAFARAIALQPSSLTSYVQFASTFLGDRTRAALRQSRVKNGVPISLVHDTTYRRARRRAAAVIHSLDDGVTRLVRGERQVILFEAASPMSFAMFRPVYERLRRDPRIEFRFTASGSTWDPSALYARVGITSGIVRSCEVAWMKVDTCINTDFWDSTWLHRRTRRIHMFHGVAGKYGLDAPVNLAPTVSTYDRLFFPNEDRLARYVDAGLVSPASPVPCLIGYPKLDCLVDGSLDRAAIVRRLALPPGREVVLYAPTWSPHSSLNALGSSIIEHLAASGFTVIVKLHDRSYDPATRGSGGIDWVERLLHFRTHPNVRVATDVDATPLLAVADALVTDHSSIGFEFSLLDRPIVVVDCPELLVHARVNPTKVADLRSASEVVGTVAEIGPAIVRQLEAPCLHREERLRLAHRFFFRPGTATARAVAAIYDLLGMEAPAWESEAESPVAAALLSPTRG